LRPIMGRVGPVVVKADRLAKVKGVNPWRLV
jgi:hypothetical protein